MRAPNVRILGLRFNDLAYLLANTIGIKYSSGIDNVLFKKCFSSFIQLLTKVFFRTERRTPRFKRNGDFWKVNKKLSITVICRVET